MKQKLIKITKILEKKYEGVIGVSFGEKWVYLNINTPIESYQLPISWDEFEYIPGIKELL